ncbi:MAG: ATP-binding protein [Campylobacterales bacterium]
MDISLFFSEQQKILRKTSSLKKRYLYHKINWENRCIAILGQRGVGKTTLMHQIIKERYNNSDKALYISVDNPYFKAISLYEFAIKFEQLGGEILFIDEVHKYKEYSSHIKSIYDATELKIVFSGSSMLQISRLDADLSRRAVVYRLANLSFREYLSISNIEDFDTLSLEDILTNHIEIANSISEKIKPLKHFSDYLKFGCYPFIKEGKDSYNQKLISIINQIIESDIPYIENISFSQIDKIKKLLYLLAVSAPFVPNISKLSASTEISRVTMSDYLRYLELASLINTLMQDKKGYGKLQKPNKLYLYNTNISYSISNNPNIGSARETFFVNQIKSYHYNKKSFLGEEILLSSTADFIIEGKYTFEIGGKSKSFSQIKDMPSSYVVADDIEVGFKNKIPLWLFGFLY